MVQIDDVIVSLDVFVRSLFVISMPVRESAALKEMLVLL